MANQPTPQPLNLLAMPDIPPDFLHPPPAMIKEETQSVSVLQQSSKQDAHEDDEEDVNGSEEC